MCRLHEILIFLLPLGKWKETVRRRHLARCSRCAGAWAAGEKEVRTFLTPRWTREARDFWPEILRRMDSPREARAGAEVASRDRPARIRPWIRIPAAAGALILLLGAFGLWLSRNRDGRMPSAEKTPPLKSEAAGPRVQVFSAELGKKPAKAYIYQTPKISFIRIAPAKDNGG